MRYNSSIFILLFGISILSSCVNTDITAEEPTAIALKCPPYMPFNPKPCYRVEAYSPRSPKAAVTQF